MKTLENATLKEIECYTNNPYYAITVNNDFYILVWDNNMFSKSEDDAKKYIKTLYKRLKEYPLKIVNPNGEVVEDYELSVIEAPIENFFISTERQWLPVWTSKDYYDLQNKFWKVIC